jgi:hypothetical protein
MKTPLLAFLAALALVPPALALVPSALAAYPTPFAEQGGLGVQARDGARYTATAAGPNTLLHAIRPQPLTRTLHGHFGVPRLTQSGQMGGLSRDGRTLVLQSMGVRSVTRFVVVGTSDLTTLQTIVLHGAFGFDALSPNATRLYLIQHTSAEDIQHYVVRAYDLRAHRLLPGRIADKTQKDWLMQGFAVSRATTADGRWAYTLYANPGGYPFIHALDTVAGTAHCIGLPWTVTDQSPVFGFRLVVRGASVAVLRPDGSTWKRVNRQSWRLS